LHLKQTALICPIMTNRTYSININDIEGSNRTGTAIKNGEI